MRRSKKKYSGKSVFDHSVLSVERSLMVNYGLRNKKEVRKSQGYVRKYQRLLRECGNNSPLFKSACSKLVGLGVLPYDPTDKHIHQLKNTHFLERRLQTLVSKLTNVSMNQSRQLIVQGHVRVNGVRKRYPSYLIRVDSRVEVYRSQDG